MEEEKIAQRPKQSFFHQEDSITSEESVTFGNNKHKLVVDSTFFLEKSEAKTRKEGLAKDLKKPQYEKSTDKVNNSQKLSLTYQSPAYFRAPEAPIVTHEKGIWFEKEESSPSKDVALADKQMRNYAAPRNLKLENGPVDIPEEVGFFDLNYEFKDEPEVKRENRKADNDNPLRKDIQIIQEQQVHRKDPIYHDNRGTGEVRFKATAPKDEYQRDERPNISYHPTEQGNFYPDNPPYSRYGKYENRSEVKSYPREDYHDHEDWNKQKPPYAQQNKYTRGGYRNTNNRTWQGDYNIRNNYNDEAMLDHPHSGKSGLRSLAKMFGRRAEGCLDYLRSMKQDQGEASLSAGGRLI